MTTDLTKEPMDQNKIATQQRFCRDLNRPGFVLTTIQSLAGCITELDGNNSDDRDKIIELAECIAYQAEQGKAELANIIKTIN